MNESNRLGEGCETMEIRCRRRCVLRFAHDIEQDVGFRLIDGVVYGSLAVAPGPGVEFNVHQADGAEIGLS